MRALVFAAAFVALVSTASAQSIPSPQCSHGLSAERARVRTFDGRTRHGRTSCAAPDALAIEIARPPDRPTAHPLVVIEPMTNVRQVLLPGDDVADGMLKGAALGLFSGLFGGGGDQCRGFQDQGSCAIAAVAGMSLVGGVVDALHGRSVIVFEQARSGATTLRRRRDSVKNGAIAGAVVFAGWCALVCGQGPDDDGHLLPVVAANAAFGAAIGAGIDAMTSRSRQTPMRGRDAAFSWKVRF